MSNLIEKTDYSLKIAAQFNDLKVELIKQSSDLLNEPRKKAFQNFIAGGLPTLKNEDYKYTNLQPLFSTDFKFNPVFSGKAFPDEDLEKLIPQINSTRIFLENGCFSNGFFSDLPKGILVGSLKETAAKNPERIRNYYNHLTTENNDPLVALNTAFATDGYFIFIPKNLQVEKNLQIINILSAETDSYFTQRNLVVVEAGASVDIFVCDVALGSKKYFANQSTEIFIGENASVNYSYFRNQPSGVAGINSVFIRQEKNSVLKTLTANLYGGLIRNNLFIELEGENCETGLYGITFSDQTQHVDNFIRVNHNKPHCNSYQLYKNVLDGQSTGAFTGRIHVKRDAQKTNAFQRNNNLVLTDEAKMFTKPQLIIDADDVKCSHGATVGQIDEEALFYLRSRGIPEKEARLMMTHAFFHEVLQQIKSESLRNSLNGLIEKRLGGEQNSVLENQS
jgi:Fe-S cluster assembly protein SufD